MLITLYYTLPPDFQTSDGSENQKLGVTFNADKLGGIDFTKF